MIGSNTTKDGFESIIISLKGMQINDIANDTSEWVINDNLDLTYLSGVATDSLYSDTSIDVNSLFYFEVLTSTYMLVWSSLMLY